MFPTKTGKRQKAITKGKANIMSGKISKRKATALVEAGLMSAEDYQKGVESGLIAGNGGGSAGEYTDNQQDCLTQLGKVLTKFSGVEKTATAMHKIDEDYFKITVYRKGTKTWRRAMGISEEDSEETAESES